MPNYIFFTGGGSGGHSFPALTLIQEIKKRKPTVKIIYIGSRLGIEKKIVQTEVDQYHGIWTGKLRRYVSFKNFTDIFSFSIGFWQAFFILAFYLFLARFKKCTLFSTGGFVSVAPVIVGRLLGYRVLLHEQTSRVGLANKIASYFCDKIFVSFENSRTYFPTKKVFYSGYPLRKEIERNKIKKFKFKEISLNELSKPILLVTGGGNGSELLNEWVDRYLLELCSQFAVFHQVGKRFIKKYVKEGKNSVREKENIYEAFDFTSEMIILMKWASIVLSRSGAGIVSELIYLNKPAILVPLKIAQRNEQYYNALEAQKKCATIITEKEFLKSSHLNILTSLIKKTKEKIKKNNSFIPDNPTKILVEEIMGLI